MAVFLAVIPANAAVNVTQHHNHASRDGLYVDPAFTNTNAATMARDTAFDGTIVGNVYAQPLYVEGGPNGPLVIAVTQSNNVYAINATTGAIVWQRNVGTPSGSMGNISPVGITSTPVVDVASRALFLNAVVSGPNNLIFSLNVDTGAINPGWPVNVNAAVSGFSSSIQSQRGALIVMGSKVYVPYGGYFGDAGSYRGRVVGVEINNPASVTSWATTATKAGIWAPGGIAHDGTNLYVTTGNASAAPPPGADRKASFVCKRARSLLARRPIIGRRRTGWRSIAATPISAVPARSSSTCRARRHRPWWSRSARIATPICLIATTSAASLCPWRRAYVSTGTSSEPPPLIRRTPASSSSFVQPAAR